MGNRGLRRFQSQVMSTSPKELRKLGVFPFLLIEQEDGLTNGNYPNCCAPEVMPCGIAFPSEMIGVPHIGRFQYPASCQIRSTVQGRSRCLGTFGPLPYVWLYMHVWHQSVICHCKEATFPRAPRPKLTASKY